MLSRTGYTRWHSTHFRLSPVSFCTSGFLHAGQTSMSSRSWETMRTFYDRRQDQASGLQAFRLPVSGFVTLPIDFPRREQLHFALHFHQVARPPCARRTGKRVQIPRCRATVSEDTATVHWAERPGKDRSRNWIRIGFRARARVQDRNPYSRARRPARTANTNPFRE